MLRYLNDAIFGINRANYQLSRNLYSIISIKILQGRNIIFFMKTVAIIGAGISGITLANLLDKRVKCSIFDKSRGVKNGN